MKSCYKAGLIRVITLPDAEAAGIHGRLIMEMFPNMTVETKCIPDQPCFRFENVAGFCKSPSHFDRSAE